MRERELPVGWGWKRLGDICKKPEYGYTTSAKKDGDGPKFLRTTDITKDVFDWVNVPFCEQIPEDEEKYQLRDGDILISRAGSVGASFVVKNPPRAVFASYLIRFQPKKELDPNFADFFLKSNIFKNQLGGSTSGTTLQGVNASNLAKIKIPLPPLSIQRQIVAVLEQADGVKRQRQEADTLTGAFLQSVFLEIFGDPVRNEKGWEVRTVDQLVKDKKSISCGPFGSQLKVSDYVDEGILVLGIDNIGISRFIWKNPRYISLKKFADLNAFVVNPEDIIISRAGTVGRTCVVPKKIHNAIIGSNLLKVTLDQSKLLPIFLTTAISYAPSIIEEIKMSSPGAMYNFLNSKNLRVLKIIVPPLALQQQFAQIIANVEALREKQRASGIEIDGLFEGLMQRAFSGELAEA